MQNIIEQIEMVSELLPHTVEGADAWSLIHDIIHEVRCSRVDDFPLAVQQMKDLLQKFGIKIYEPEHDIARPEF